VIPWDVVVILAWASLCVFITASALIWVHDLKWSKKKAAKREETKKLEEEQRRLSAKLDFDELRELMLTKPEAEEEIKLERMKAYIERPTQKLLQNLMEGEKKTEILPAYDPFFGFRYKTVESVFDENVSPVEAEELLERLYHLEILEKKFFDTVSACPVCGSTSLTLHHRCPKCSGRHIVKTGLTEHVPCGNIDEREKYYQGHWMPVCPKCEARLIEGEYRDMGLWYICRECGEKFEHPHLNLICRKCNNEFTTHTAIVREISRYFLNPDKEREIRQNVTSLESIYKLLTEIGFSVETSALAIGEKSGIQHTFSLVAKKEIGDHIKLVAIDHAVGDTEVGAPPLILFTYKISEVKVDLPIFVAIPKLNETAKRIAQGYNIMVIEGLPQKREELAMLHDEIQKRLQYHEAERREVPGTWKKLLRRQGKIK